MKKLIANSLILTLSLFVTTACFAQNRGMVIPTTSFTRELLRKNSAEEVKTYLGISGGGGVEEEGDNYIFEEGKLRFKTGFQISSEDGNTYTKFQMGEDGSGIHIYGSPSDVTIEGDLYVQGTIYEQEASPDSFKMTSKAQVQLNQLDDFSACLINQIDVSSLSGFLRIVGTKESSTDRCDVLLYLSALPYSTNIPNICQLQGAVDGSPFRLALSHDSAGSVKLYIIQEEPGAWTYNIYAFGDNIPMLIPELGFGGLIYEAYLTVANGQFIANNVQADRIDVSIAGESKNLAKLYLNDGMIVLADNDNHDTLHIGDPTGGNITTLRVHGPLRLGNEAVAETPSATHTLIIYDSTGTAYKILAVPANP